MTLSDALFYILPFLFPQDMCTRARGILDCFLVYRSDAIEDMSSNGIDGCRQVESQAEDQP